MDLNDVDTPVLALDRAKLHANIVRMRDHLAALGVGFRPHLKTAKSIDVARCVIDAQTVGITVSTLHEADYFLANGITDILYGVTIAPTKLAHAETLMRNGAALKIVTDSVDSARMIADYGRTHDIVFDVLIEIDSDGHRAGLKPDDTAIIETARCLTQAGGARLAGVMTHAGGSYASTSIAEIADYANRERDAVVAAAALLRGNGFACPVVSLGSTPTARFATDLSGVTDVRAGVYMFQDLVMAGLEVCTPEEIALSVVTTVIGHQREKNWIIVDAGWMAMSRDRGTAKQPLDQGYGLVCDLDGRPIADLVMVDANQEHGVLRHRHDPAATPMLPVGTMLRILPNHACATGAQHGAYAVVAGDTDIRATWPRFRGWGLT